MLFDFGVLLLLVLWNLTCSAKASTAVADVVFILTIITLVFRVLPMNWLHCLTRPLTNYIHPKNSLPKANGLQPFIVSCAVTRGMKHLSWYVSLKCLLTWRDAQLDTLATLSCLPPCAKLMRRERRRRCRTWSPIVNKRPPHGHAAGYSYSLRA